MKRGPWLWSIPMPDKASDKHQRMLDRSSRCRRAKRLRQCAERRRLARQKPLTERT
jgi:hypothetical protein